MIQLANGQTVQAVQATPSQTASGSVNGTNNSSGGNIVMMVPNSSNNTDVQRLPIAGKLAFKRYPVKIIVELLRQAV